MVITALCMVIASCGGGSNKTAAPKTGGTSDVTVGVSDSTTTELAPTASTVADVSVSATSTTTKAVATTAASKTKVTSPKTTLAAPAAPEARTQVTAPTATTAQGEPPQPGGTLTVLMPADLRGFDPTVESTTNGGGSGAQRLTAVYDKLLYQDPNSGALVPEIAESLTTSDATVWTMKIRPNVKFSDGTPYDAAAVKFNWDRHADPANASPWAATAKAMTHDVTDPLTLKITLKSTSGQFPRVIADQISFIASPTAVKAAGSQQAYNSKPVGAGPFMLKEWARDSQEVMIRNPSYWNAPRPYLDQLIFRPITDEQQRLNTFNAGQGQVNFTTNVVTANSVSGSASAVQSPSINTIVFYMNLKRANPFQDKGVRKAIQLAVDIDQINQVQFGGGLEAPHAWFPSNYPFSDPSLIFGKNDLVQAQALIDNYVKANGKDVVFTWMGGATAQAVQLAQLVQGQVQRLNHVKMNIDGVASAQFATQFLAGQYDVATFAYNGVDPDNYYLEELASKGSRNFQGYLNPDIDPLVVQSRTTTDINARLNAIKQIERIAMDDMPFFPLYRNPVFYTLKTNIKDFVTIDDGGFLPDRVWIKTN